MSRVRIPLAETAREAGGVGDGGILLTSVGAGALIAAVRRRGAGR